MLNSETFKGHDAANGPAAGPEESRSRANLKPLRGEDGALIGTMSFAMKSTMTDLKDADAHNRSGTSRSSLKGGGKDNSPGGPGGDQKARQGEVAPPVFSTEKGLLLSQKSAIEPDHRLDGQPLAMRWSIELTLGLPGSRVRGPSTPPGFLRGFRAAGWRTR